MTRTRHFANCLGVFQGGGCKALAFVGAFEEAVNRGVFFSQVSGTSAGSLIACLVAAGASPEYLRQAISETDFERFKSPADKTLFETRPSLAVRAFRTFPNQYQDLARAAATLGLYSSKQIEVWLEAHLRKLLDFDKSRKVTFSDLHIPLHVVATELREAKPTIWSTALTPDVSVSYAVRCSCSVPFFFQPVDRIYVDGGVVSNLPAFVLDHQIERGFEKVLCFAFSTEAAPSPAATSELIQLSKNLSIRQLVEQLASAAIDGAVSIQGSLQSDLHFVTLRDLPLGTLDFDKIDTTSVEAMFEAGRKSARQFFDDEIANLRAESPRRLVLTTESQTLNHLVRRDYGQGDKLTFCLRTNRFTFNLFPSLLAWRTRGATVRFVLPEHFSGRPDEEEQEALRTLVLRGLGCEVRYIAHVQMEAIVSENRDGRIGDSTVLLPRRDDKESAGYATTYDPYFDSDAISLMSSHVQTPSSALAAKPFQPEITPFPESKLFERLRDVRQYGNPQVQFSVEEVDVGRIVFLSRYVKSYKYTQISRLFEIIESCGRDISDCAWLSYSLGKNTFRMPITPPVAEAQGNKYYLIEGNSRLTYLVREKRVERVKLVVVRNVSDPLPSSGRYPAKGLVVSDEKKIGASRYDNFKLEHFRHIERAARDPLHYRSLF